MAVKLQASKRSLALAAALVLVGAGCATGPAYKAPDLAPPAQFRGEAAAPDTASMADMAWWDVFKDEALQGLIRQGLSANYDIQVAVARIERARALLGVVQSQGKPQIGFQAAAGGENAFVPGRTSAETVDYGFARGAFDAAWEFDLWGRIRHSTDAARANLLAQEDVRRGVMLTLVSDIAAGYFRLVELDRELAIADESARTYKQTLDLFTLRFEAGRDSNLPVQRAQAAYESSAARSEELRREIAQQENALSILAGDYPKAIVRGHALVGQSLPPTPVGSTTELLQRRPDILEAEQRMVAANAEIGVAAANFFPRVGLSALLGAQGVDINDNWHGFSMWNLALAASGPIFTGGRLKQAYRERQAFWDETVAQYKQTVLVAFRETSDALAAQQTLVPRRAALERQVTALRRSSDLALARYDAGRASYFEVLEAQQELFPAEDALAQTQRDQLVAVVSLYKALGGGWKLTPAEWSGPQ